MRTVALFCVWGLAGIIAACGASGRDPATGNSDGGDVDPSEEGGISGDGGNVNRGDAGKVEQPGKTLLYAHTDKTLFSFDPDNLKAAPVELGDFDCIGGSGDPPSMTDIGVTKDGKLYGVSAVAAYPLTVKSNKVVHCDETWPLPDKTSFYGVTVTPENTLATDEVVIASNAGGQLFRIDATTGKTTQVGTLGRDPDSGKSWSLSGDIVLLANGGSPIGFATVRTCDGTSASTCDTVDTLIELDVAKIKPGTQSALKAVRGKVIRGGWCTNAASPDEFGSMYGIAAFGAKVYGFSRAGNLVEIDNNDGSGCLVADYPDLKFAGAGVTTTAPVQAPVPK